MLRVMRALVAMALLAGGAAEVSLAAGNAVAVAEQYPAFCHPDPGLDGPRRVRVSPDGQHVYVLGEFISVWERQPNGALVFVEEDQTVSLPTGFATTRFVIAPDGGHLYVGGPDAVWVYARDAITGEVSFVQTLVGGMGGVPGLGTVTSLFVSPDGANVYVSAGASIVVFTRDAVTGMLTHLETQTTGVGGVVDLDTIVDVVVSPGGEHLYAGAFDDTGGFNGNAVVGRFDRDLGSGALTFVDVTVVRTPGGNTTGFTRSLRASPDGLSLYLASSYSFIGFTYPELQSIARDPVTGDLTLVGTPLDIAPGDLEIAPDGAHGYWRGGSRLHRDPVTGILSDPDPGPVFSGDGLQADRLAIAPDGVSLYVLDQFDALVTYDRDLPSGDLTYVQGLEGQLTAPLHLALSADEENLYATCSAGVRHGDTIVTLDRDPSTGDVTPVGTLRHALDVPDGLRMPSYLLASGDGQNVYVVASTNAGPCVVTTFDRDGVSGLLTYADMVAIPGATLSGSTGLCPAGPLVEGPDGGNVYVAGGFAHQLYNFERDPVLGTLTFVESVPLPQGGGDLVLAPDGSRLVVATEDGLASVARDVVDGSLGTSVSSFVEVGELTSPVFATNGDFWLVNGSPSALWSLDYDPATGALDVRFKETRVPISLARVVLDEAGGYLLGGAGSEVVTFRRDASGAAFLADQIPTGAGNATDTVLATTGPEAYVAHRDATIQLSRVVRVPACATSPMGGCRTSTQPGAGLVFAKRPGNATRSKLKWKLVRGEAADPADFGDPTATTGQALCLYDASGSGDALVAAEVRPGGTCGAKPCWKATNSGFVYKASLPDRQPDGVAKMALKAGPAGKSSIKVIVAGGALGLPADAFVPPVVVQLQDTDGGCWEATVTTPAINEPGKFKAKPD